MTESGKASLVREELRSSLLTRVVQSFAKVLEVRNLRTESVAASKVVSPITHLVPNLSTAAHPPRTTVAEMHGGYVVCM